MWYTGDTTSVVVLAVFIVIMTRKPKTDVGCDQNIVVVTTNSSGNTYIRGVKGTRKFLLFLVCCSQILYYFGLHLVKVLVVAHS